MQKAMKNTNTGHIYNSIKQIIENARKKIYYAANTAMVHAYWQIGQIIVEEEQKGKARAEYGESLIKDLSLKLTREYGSGFNWTNLKYIRKFYMMFPKGHALRDQLTWTHYRLLLRVEKEAAINFYIIESINNKWSTRELDRQINSLLYERLTLSKNKKKVKELSCKGQIIQKKDIRRIE